jgi:hypothetical protein
MSGVALVVIALYCALAVFVSLAYFFRFDALRPPIGTMNLRDVVFGLGAIALVPYLYLAIPVWAIVVLMGGFWIGLISLLLGPIVTDRAARWAISCSLVVADVFAMELLGAGSLVFRFINNGALVAVAVAIANLWAQSGLRIRDLAILTVGLMVYDPLATSYSSVMTELMRHFQTAPLQPAIIWGSGSNQVGVGFGDVTMAALLPAVIMKAYGNRLALIAAALMSVVPALGFVVIRALAPTLTIFPAMVMIGPAILLLCLVGGVRSGGRERTTFEFRQSRIAIARR